MPEIGFTLIGNGKIAQKHIKAIKSHQNAFVEVIIDPETKSPEYRTYKDLKEAPKNRDAKRFASICSPSGMHFNHAIQCLNFDYNLIIEKPITLKAKEAKKIVARAEQNQLRVYSSMQLRLSPQVQYIKKLLEENSLGNIYMININCFWNRNEQYYKNSNWHGSKELDGGVLFTQFSHFIDVLGYWFKEIKLQNSERFTFINRESSEVPDSGIIRFNVDETQGSMSYTTATYAKNYQSNITILAEKGTICLGDQYLNQFKHFDVERVEKPELESKTELHKLMYQEIISSFVEQRTSIFDAKKAIGLIQFIEQAQQL